MAGFLHRIKAFTYTRYLKVSNSIAFIPTLVSMLFFILAVLLLYFEQNNSFNRLKETIPWINIKSAENARVIVSTILAGLISLTVFSFSMVMSILSQAYSSFTPKVIGGVISNKSNQTILGFYIGSIIYCLVVLISFRDNDNYSVLPSVAIVVSTFFGLCSLALFVKFLNDISQEIQIKNVIKRINKATIHSLKSYHGKEDCREIDFNPDAEQWFTYPAAETGYFQNINRNDILKVAEEEDFVIKIVPVAGDFIVNGLPLFSVNKPQGKEIVRELSENFNFYSEEKIEVNDFFGFRQLTEIATKALSPGINDTGTAIICIDYICSLLVLKMKSRDEKFISGQNEKVRIIYSLKSFKDYLDTCFIPIFLNGKQDVDILLKLLNSIKILSYFDRQDIYREILVSLADYLVNGADRYIHSPYERVKITNLVNLLKQESYFHKLCEII